MNSSKATNPFPDWLNPIVVKELRQGLRSTIFSLTFLLMQAGMLYYTLIVFTEGNSVRELFWFMLSLLFLLVIPFRGVGVLNDEIRDNTLDLLLLTELSPRRIIFGKWLALALQSFLMIVTILPYVVLTYFTGDGNLVSELLTLGSLFIGGIIVTTLMMQIPQSARPLSFVLVPLVFFVGAISSSFFFRRSGISVVDWMGFLFMGALLALYVAMCLENVAGRITPPGINTTLGKRLLAALFLAMGAACAMPPGMFLLLLLAASPVVLGILCEAPTPLASLYLPPKRLRHTLAGRWTMPFLYPGSASGLLWFTALLGGMGAILVARDSDCTRLFLLLEAAGTLLIPLLLLRLLRIRRLILLSIILQAAIFLIAILLRTRHGHDPTFSGAITLPPFGFWNYLFSSQPTLVHADNSLLLPGSILAAVLAICFVIDYRQWRTIRELQATLQTA